VQRVCQHHLRVQINPQRRTYRLNEADTVDQSDWQAAAFNGFHNLGDRLLSHKRTAGHAIGHPLLALAQLQHLLDDRFEHSGNILA